MVSVFISTILLEFYKFPTLFFLPSVFFDGVPGKYGCGNAVVIDHHPEEKWGG